MLTRTLVPLTLLLALTGGADPLTPSATDLDSGRAGHRPRLVDDVGGCREPAPRPTPVPAAPAACSDEAQP
jgi:hypothetical protein